METFGQYLERNKAGGPVDYDQRKAEISAMLARLEPRYSVGGFVGNIRKDAMEIVRGLPGLVPLAYKAVTDPVKTLPQIVGGLKEFYGEALRNPPKYVYERPVSALLDALMLWSGGAGALSKVGMAGKLAQAGKVAAVAPRAAGMLGRVAEIGGGAARAKELVGLRMAAGRTGRALSHVPGIEAAAPLARMGKYTPHGLIQSHVQGAKEAYLKAGEEAARTKTGAPLEALPPYTRWLGARTAGKEAGALLVQADREMVALTRIGEGKIVEVLKPIPKDQHAKIWNFVEDELATVNPEKMKWFEGSSPAVQDAVNFIRDWGDLQASEWVKAGIITEESARSRLWAPAAFRRLEAGGLTQAQRVKLLSEAQKTGILSKIERLLITDSARNKALLESQRLKLLAEAEHLPPTNPQRKALLNQAAELKLKALQMDAQRLEIMTEAKRLKIDKPLEPPVGPLTSTIEAFGLGKRGVMAERSRLLTQARKASPDELARLKLDISGGKLLMTDAERAKFLEELENLKLVKLPALAAPKPNVPGLMREIEGYEFQVLQAKSVRAKLVAEAEYLKLKGFSGPADAQRFKQISIDIKRFKVEELKAEKARLGAMAKAKEVPLTEIERQQLAEAQKFLAQEIGATEVVPGGRGAPDALATKVIEGQGIPREVYMAWPKDQLEMVVKVIGDTIREELPKAGVKLDQRGAPTYLSYIHHLTEEGMNSIWSNWRLRSGLPKKQTLSAQRQLTGSKNLVVDLDLALRSRNAMQQKALAHSRLLEQIKAHPSTRAFDGANLLPGHVIYAPDLISWSTNQQLKMTDKLLVKIRGHRGLFSESELKGVVTEIIEQQKPELFGQYMGLLKEHGYVSIPGLRKGIYQVPREVAERFRPAVSGPIETWFKLFYDTPISYWRAAVLPLSPRWIVYNTVGNTILNMLAGVTPADYLRYPRLRKFVPESLGMGITAIEGGPAARLGKLAEETAVGRGITRLEASRLGRGASAAANVGRRANTAIENLYRGVNFTSSAYKQARAELAAMGRKPTWEAIEAKIAAYMKDPAMVRKFTDHVNEFLFDYMAISGNERRIIRRLVPFMSWHKNILRLTLYSLPVKYPGRLALLRGLSRMGSDYMDDLYVKYGVSKADLPLWMRNGIPMEANPETGEITMWNPAGINPFQTIGALDLALVSPAIKIVLERALGMDLFRMKKFTSPTAVEMGGRNMKFNPLTQRFEEVRVAPPLTEHVLRQVPQYGLLKALRTPAQQYSTGTLWRPQPIMRKEGKGPDARMFPAIPISRQRELLKMVGMSTFGLTPQGTGEEMSQNQKRMLTMLMNRLKGMPELQKGVR